jgi:hypothetical protein
MLFRKLVHDFEHPVIEARAECGQVVGFAYDSRITDSGVDSLYVLPESRNVDVTIDPFTPGADTVRYRASLRDRYSDGLVAMKVVDSSGRSRTQSNPLPGFTVRAVGMTSNAPIRLDTLRMITSDDTCVSFTLENNGKYPQTIAKLELLPLIPGSRFDVPVPFTLQPGATMRVGICAGGWADTIVDATVVIYGECETRGVATLAIISGIDTVPPSVTSSDVDCGRGVTLTVSDPRASLVGEIRFDTLINGRILMMTPDEGQLPVAVATIRLGAIDPYHDMIYQLRVTDLAGNVAVYRDTIGGFTITAIDDARDSVSIRFDRELRMRGLDPGEQRCDSVTLMNYGARALLLSTVRLDGNAWYSIPPSQLPFTIPPYSERRLCVCLEGTLSGLLRDTLVLTDGCGRADTVLLRGVVARLSATDRCNNALNITSIGASKRTFLATPHPNPSSGGSASVDIGLSSDAAIALELIDAAGATASTIMSDIEMRAGLHRVTFDISGLGNGTYYCRLRTAGGEMLVEKMVVAR